MSEQTAVKIKTLLIEDNENDMIIVEDGLSLEGKGEFEVIWANSLSKALNLLKAEEPDVALLDLGLPDSKGLEGLERICKEAPSLPVIVLTGLNDEATGLQAIQSGAQDFLVKGQMAPAVIRRVIHYAIERKRSLLMKDHFMNLVSHELRSPLGILKELLMQLSEGLLGPVTKKQEDCIAMGMETLKRMEDTSSTLLDLAKIESGKVELTSTAFDLIELAKSLASGFRFPIEKKGLILEEDYRADKVMLTADRNKIAQVLTNFLNNAAKFTQKGIIILRVTERPEAIVCEVEDTGVGLAANDLPKVFNKYEQFGRYRDKKAGTGLGLSICKEIIGLHDGQIAVRSELEKGSVFSFSLPRK